MNVKLFTDMCNYYYPPIMYIMHVSCMVTTNIAVHYPWIIEIPREASFLLILIDLSLQNNSKLTTLPITEELDTGL